MTEFELFKQAHDVVRDALNSCTDSTQRKHLDKLRKELWHRVQFHSGQGAPALVFALHGSYVVVGGEGSALATLPHPALAGLDDGWAIICNGVSGNSSLHAEDIVGVGKQPGNTLRNRLSEAAEWLERTAHMPELARVFRRPCIEIARDGYITYRPTMHPPIRLQL